MTTAFRPSQHGFRFANHFKEPLLAAALKPFPITPSYGLCGGMALLARDCFAFDVPIPPADAPPQRGSRLHAALFRRQCATYGPPPLFPNVLKFGRWTVQPDAAVQKQTLATWRDVRHRLERGELVQLGLLYVRRLSRLWHNHQVLAYDYASSPDGQATDVRVYDPNYPLRDDVVICARQESGRLVCEQYVGNRFVRPVCGFFGLRLRAQRPPADGLL